MSDLDIYDPPAAVKQASVPATKTTGVIRSKVKEYSSIINTEISEKRDYCASLENKVLTTVKPVTRYIPITYDTVKRVSVISLCTFSGVLQGRKRGGFRRYLYPVVAFMGGNASCYPKQTYQMTTFTLRTALPLVASAGKVTVEGGIIVFHQTKVVSSFIYEKLKEQFPDKPTPGPTQIVPAESTALDAEIIPETAGGGPKAEDSLADEVSSIVPEEHTQISESAVESVAKVAEAPLVEEVTAEESSDKIIPLKKLHVPTEFLPIKENLGMGDRDHSDMYSTRSRRS